MSAIAQIWNAAVTPIKTDAEEAELIVAAKAGGETATLRLFTAYVALARGVIRQCAATLPVDDARQVAFLGFVQAIKEHDPARADRLAGKLRIHLQDALTEAASSATGGFTVPARTLRRFFGILKRADGDVAQAAKLAPEYEMTEDAFWAVLTAVQADESLDLEIEINGGADGVSVMDEIASPREITDVEDRILVEVAFKAVDDLEAKVTGLAYGFLDYDPVPDAEIGHRLGFSRLKALRIRQRSLGKMREALGA